MKYLFAHRLKTLGWKKLMRVLKRQVTRLAYTLMMPVVYISALIFSKFTGKDYRFGTINLSSIGGIIQLDAFLRRTAGCKKPKHIFVPRYEKIINPFFYELMKRHVYVVENFILKFFLTSLVLIPNSLRFTKEVEFIMPCEVDKYSPYEWFNSDDHLAGKELLKNFGITAGRDWYVCFFARDNAYNQNFNVGDERNYNLEYHSSRNSDIDCYSDAMKFVLAKGGYVIRMGMIAEKRVNFQHPRLVDYPFSPFKSPFADIYLMCHARFVIGTGGGLVETSSITDRPLGSVNNYIPWMGYGRKNMIFIPKLIKSTRTANVLSLSQYKELFNGESGADNLIVHMGIMKKEGLYYVDNSPAEILEVTAAMFEGTSTSPNTFEVLLDKDNQIWSNFVKLHPGLTRDMPLRS